MQHTVLEKQSEKSLETSVSNLICYTFGHSLKHLYDVDLIDMGDYLEPGPEYLAVIYCSRWKCGHRVDLA